MHIRLPEQHLSLLVADLPDGQALIHGSSRQQSSSRFWTSAEALFFPSLYLATPLRMVYPLTTRQDDRTL